MSEKNAALVKAVNDLFGLAGSDRALVGHMKDDFVRFLCYLSASDGTIAVFEADFIRDYLQMEFSPEGLKAFIVDNGIYTVKFEQTVPVSFKALVAADNAVWATSGQLSVSRGKAFYCVLEAVGKEFLVCDGAASEDEVRDMTIYLAMLEAYLKSHLEAPFDTPSAVSICGDPQQAALSALIDELNSLIGLQAVKNDVNSLIHLQDLRRLRRQRGLKDLPVSNHLVFYGNPGTGKTTVARLLAKIYHAMGILSKGQFVEVDRSGLVAGYVGQTALKVQEVVQSALGGVLFIDEAYALTYSGSGNDYGQEAVDTLIKAMEDHRDDFILIVAGYPELMARFLSSNPGLRSRFNKYIHFADYNAGEMTQIFRLMCDQAGYSLTPEALAHAGAVFEEKYRMRGPDFANGREVRNFFEKAMLNQADRLFTVDDPSDEALTTFILEDLEKISDK